MKEVVIVNVILKHGIPVIEKRYYIILGSHTNPSLIALMRRKQ